MKKLLILMALLSVSLNLLSDTPYDKKIAKIKSRIARYKVEMLENKIYGIQLDIDMLKRLYFRVIAPAYNQLAYLIGSALNKLIICSGRFCTLRI